MKVLFVAPITATENQLTLASAAIGEQIGDAVTVFPDTGLVAVALAAGKFSAVVVVSAPEAVRGGIVAACGQLPVYRPVRSVRKTLRGEKITNLDGFVIAA